MKPPTDYIRHAARLARKLQMDAAMGAHPSRTPSSTRRCPRHSTRSPPGLELVCQAGDSDGWPQVRDSQAELEKLFAAAQRRAAPGGRHRGGQLSSLSRPGLSPSAILPTGNRGGGSPCRTSLAPLGAALADPAIEIVFHDADYDLGCCDQEYGFRAANLFDTRVAAQLLNEPGVGLAALLEKYLGVQLDKRYQRADWSARPLSPEMLEYAAADTRHLPALRDMLRRQLQERGRLEWAEEEFALLSGVRWAAPEPTSRSTSGSREPRRCPDGHWRFCESCSVARAGGPADRQGGIPDSQQRADAAMAKTPPADLSALKAVRGVGRRQAERRGQGDPGGGAAGPGGSGGRPAPTRPAAAPAADPAYEARLERLKAARNLLATAIRPGARGALSQRQPRGHCPDQSGDARGDGGDAGAAALAAAGDRRQAARGASTTGSVARTLRSPGRSEPGGPSSPASSKAPTPARPRPTHPLHIAHHPLYIGDDLGARRATGRSERHLDLDLPASSTSTS